MSSAGNGIKKARLERDGKFFTLAIGMRRFKTIPEFVEYYSRHPIYRSTRITHPVNASAVLRQVSILDRVFRKVTSYQSCPHWK
jgi:hypothetical protein